MGKAARLLCTAAVFPVLEEERPPDVLAERLSIVRIGRPFPGFQISLEAEKIEPPARCRACILVVGTRETTMGKDYGGDVSVCLQVELDVVTLPSRVGDLPAHASGRVKLFEGYLCYKTPAIEPKLSGGTNLRLDCCVARRSNGH